MKDDGVKLDHERCKGHPEFSGLNMPTSGCPTCWKVWLCHARFRFPTDADAKYIAKMQSRCMARPRGTR